MHDRAFLRPKSREPSGTNLRPISSRHKLFAYLTYHFLTFYQIHQYIIDHFISWNTLASLSAFKSSSTSSKLLKQSLASVVFYDMVVLYLGDVAFKLEEPLR